MNLTNANEFRRLYCTDTKTHEEMALEYMERYGTITQLEALIAFGSMRLGARIYRLRHRDGYNIKMNLSDEGYGIYSLAD